MKKRDFFKNKKNLITFGIVFIGIIICLLMTYLNSKPKPKEISYKQFIELAKEKKVSEVKVYLLNDTFKFKDTNDISYITDNPKHDTFKKDLLDLDLKVEEFVPLNIPELIYKMIYLSLVCSLVHFSFKTFKSTELKNNKPINTIPSIKFKDIAGNDEIVKDIEVLVDFIKNHKKYNEKGAKLPKGVILYGPPGTGKTLTAKAIAGESGVPFFSVSGANFIELYAGVGAKRVRELFAEAKKNSPSIIFIDELDAIGGKRTGSSNDEQRQTINALLTELDGFNENNGVLVIAATNKLEDLDDALTRAGRFDKHIKVPLPSTPKDRLKIINLHSKNKKFNKDVNLETLSKETIGFSGADIESLLNESTIISVQDKKDLIDKECLDKAFYQKVLKGHEKKDPLRDKDELKLVAYHEAGHTLIAKLLTNIDVPKVTIVQSTSGTGGVTFLTPKKLGLKSFEELQNEIKIAYGGRAGEQILLKSKSKLTTGAYNDIQQATSYIENIVTSYGLNEKVGLLNLNTLQNYDKNIIFEECSKISNKLYNETLRILNENENKLINLANALLEKETLSETEINKILEINE